MITDYSFLDQFVPKDSKLWKNRLSDDEKADLLQQPILYSSKFRKKTSKGTLSKKSFFLTNKAIYYKNSPTSTKIKGMISLENTLVDFDVCRPAFYDIFGEETNFDHNLGPE